MSYWVLSKLSHKALSSNPSYVTGCHWQCSICIWIYIVSSLLATTLKESESEKDTQWYLKFTFCWVWEIKLVICKSPNWMTELLFARIYMCHLCYFLFWKSVAAQDNIFQKEAWWSFCVFHSSKLENKWFFSTSIFLPKIGMDGPSPRFRGFWGK